MKLRDGSRSVAIMKSRAFVSTPPGSTEDYVILHGWADGHIRASASLLILNVFSVNRLKEFLEWMDL